MEQHVRLAVALIMIVFSTQSHSTELLSHMVLNLPFEYQTDNPWVRIIGSQEEWEEFYRELIQPLEHVAQFNGFSLDADAPSDIDFDTYTLIAGGLGFRPSNGTSLSVESVIETYSTVYINALAVEPGANCLSGAQVTYPTTALLIRNTDKNIRIYLSEARSVCE